MVALAEPRTWPNSKPTTPFLRHSRSRSPKNARVPAKLTSEDAYPRFTDAMSGQRFYKPEISRWISRDPIGRIAGVNIYNFVGNNPINQSDYNGLDKLSVGNSTIIRNLSDPSTAHVVRYGTYSIDRCNIIILVGHDLRHPAVMEVAQEDTGCAFGIAYGCWTGGGTRILDEAASQFLQSQGGPAWAEVEALLYPAVVSPGIESAPEQPDSAIEGPVMSSYISQAFTAAIGMYSDLCGAPCCCWSVHIEVVAAPGEEDQDIIAEQRSATIPCHQ